MNTVYAKWHRFFLGMISPETQPHHQGQISALETHENDAFGFSVFDHYVRHGATGKYADRVAPLNEQGNEEGQQTGRLIGESIFQNPNAIVLVAIEHSNILRAEQMGKILHGALQAMKVERGAGNVVISEARETEELAYFDDIFNLEDYLKDKLKAEQGLEQGSDEEIRSLIIPAYFDMPEDQLRALRVTPPSEIQKILARHSTEARDWTFKMKTGTRGLHEVHRIRVTHETHVLPFLIPNGIFHIKTGGFVTVETSGQMDGKSRFLYQGQELKNPPFTSIRIDPV